MSGEARERLFGFDVIRGVLILAIVAAHSLEIGALETEPGRTLYYVNYTFHVPAIVFLSGWFVKRERITARWAGENALYYLSLFLVGKLLYYGAFLLLDGALPPWTQSSVWGEVAVPWYMLSLAEWYVLLLVLRRANAWAVGLLSVAAALAAGFAPSVGGMFSLSRTLVFFPFFFLGYALPKQKLQAFFEKQSPASRAAACAGLLALLTPVGVWIRRAPVLYGMTLNLLYGNCGYRAALQASFGPEAESGAWLCAVFRAGAALFAAVCIALLLLALAGLRSRAWLWDKLAFVGRNTLPVYLAHYPILLLLWRRVVPAGMPGTACCAAAVALAPAVAAALVWCPLGKLLSGWRKLCSRIINGIVHQ